MEKNKQNLLQKLLNVQTKLKAPKNQYNKFGNYNYRSCEDILEALKPLLDENKLTLCITDEVQIIGDRFYVIATVKLSDVDSSETIETRGYAREEKEKKGMDGSQITGASSSYARKYALNAMFLIDDTKDSDFTNTHGNEGRLSKKTTTKTEKEPELTRAQNLKELKNILTEDELKLILQYFNADTLDTLTDEQLRKTLVKIKSKKG